MKIILFGAGMVGTAIAADLSKNFQVSAVDLDAKRLENLYSQYNIRIIKQDLKEKSVISEILKDYDLAINAVPGFFGYEILKLIIEGGKNVVDISFFPEDPFSLNALAIEKKVTAVVDCGVAPGLSNIIFGYNYRRYKLKSYRCYVGGLPFERKYPYQYKAPFSPADVIEEYVRPARIRENGIMKIKPALSEPELIDFDKVGSLEAFNSDGLRSLLSTMDTPDMIEKTLRYPGHVDTVRILRDSGFFSREELTVNGVKVRPVDLSSKLLFNIWKLRDEDDEFTVLRVILNSADKEITYDMMDVRDKFTGFSSMARTTGFTCTAVVNLVAQGKFNRKGICPPEYIGMEGDNFEYVRNYLNERNVLFSEKISDKNL